MSTPPLYQLALSGFAEARQRLSEGRATQHVTSVLVTAMEAAFWANALDGRLWKDDLTYKSLTGAGPELMAGLRYVRNRAAHQLPMSVEATGGLRAPLTPPLTIHPVIIRWTAAASLPPEDPGHRDSRGAAAYEARLAGHPVDDVLAEVAEWFASEQGRPGSLLSP